MLESMLKLRDWQDKHGENWVRDFVDLRHNHYSRVKSEDKARRRFSHHFHKIRLMLDTGVVKEDFIKKLVSIDQVTFLLDVIEPLEEGINPKYDRSTLNFFRSLYH